MKNGFFQKSILALGLMFASANSYAESSNFGIVNFSTCITDSKVGKDKQASFENLKNQMSAHLEDTEKQINELAGKFNDPDYSVHRII